MQEKIKKLIKESIEAKEKLLAPEQIAVLEKIGSLFVSAYRSGNKIIAFGNGGSAGDAQHLVAELVVRFEKNRKALPALALTTNTSNLTAIGNDFSYEDIFSRQVEAFAQPGDIIVGISTSGKSSNVLKALELARKQKAVTVGFTGGSGGMMKDNTDACFIAPSPVTARIQECHILAVHILCSIVEEKLFAEK